MRRARGWWTVGVFGLTATVGCYSTDSKDTSAPFVEEFRVPPNEERFNNPPELGYRKSEPKPEFKPSAGGLGGPSGPGGMSGMGGSSRFGSR